MKLKFEEENKGKIEIICQKYYQIVYDHCFFSLLNRSMAGDIIHDTFLKAFRNIENIKLDNNVKYYLFKIADNLIADYYRKEKVERDNAIKYYEKEKLEFDISPIRYMSKEEIIHKLEEVLPIDDIRLLSMLYIERQSYKEIAKELKISKNSELVGFVRTGCTESEKSRSRFPRVQQTEIAVRMSRSTQEDDT